MACFILIIFFAFMFSVKKFNPYLKEANTTSEIKEPTTGNVFVGACLNPLKVEWENDKARDHNRSSGVNLPNGSYFKIPWNHSVWMDNKEMGFREDGVIVWRVDEKD